MAVYKIDDIVIQAIFEPNEIKPGQEYIVVDAEPSKNIYKIKGTHDGDIRLLSRQNLDTYFKKR